MGRDRQAQEFVDELPGVVALVGADRHLRGRVGHGLARIRDHRLGGLAFGVAVGMRDYGVDNQPIAVVGEGVAHIRADYLNSPESCSNHCSICNAITVTISPSASPRGSCT